MLPRIVSWSVEMSADRESLFGADVSSVGEKFVPEVIRTKKNDTSNYCNVQDQKHHERLLEL